MKLVDDRTDDQKLTHTVLITATDKFMTGWGEAAQGLSKCAWACTRSQDWEKVYKWVKARKEMKYVNVTFNNWKPRNAAHVHIYVVNENHPSLNTEL